MRNTFLSAVLILGLMSPDVAVWAQTPARKSGAKKPAATSAKSAGAKKTANSKKKKKPVSTARVRRVKRAFVASAELKSMARQLVDNRTPAGYGGGEAEAGKHAGRGGVRAKACWYG